jgi:hypothetical protein
VETLRRFGILLVGGNRLVQFVRGDRAAEKPALPCVASEPMKNVGLFLCFHAFGDRPDTQTLPQA